MVGVIGPTAVVAGSRSPVLGPAVAPTATPARVRTLLVPVRRPRRAAVSTVIVYLIVILIPVVVVAVGSPGHRSSPDRIHRDLASVARRSGTG